MIIGTFRTQEDGFIGHIITLSFGTTPVVLVPTNDAKTFEMLIVGKDDDITLKIGMAKKKDSKKGGHLEAMFDCPALPSPITATMKLTPSREGIYTMEWERVLKKKGNK